MIILNNKNALLLFYFLASKVESTRGSETGRSREREEEKMTEND